VKRRCAYASERADGHRHGQCFCENANITIATAYGEPTLVSASIHSCSRTGSPMRKVYTDIPLTASASNSTAHSHLSLHLGLKAQPRQLQVSTHSYILCKVATTCL